MVFNLIYFFKFLYLELMVLYTLNCVIFAISLCYSRPNSSIILPSFKPNILLSVLFIITLYRFILDIYMQRIVGNLIYFFSSYI